MRSLIVACLLLAACSREEYVCARHIECVAKEGGFGLCLANHCAFLDTTCPASFPWRFDEAGGKVAGICATAPPMAPRDAGPSDAGEGDAAPAEAIDAAPEAVDAAPETVDAAPETVDAPLDMTDAAPRPDA